MNKSQSLYKLVRESVISQALLTAIVGIGAIVCQITTGDVPLWLELAFASVLGYYFGAGGKHSANRVEEVIEAAVELTPPEKRTRASRIVNGERPTDTVPAVRRSQLED